jgi:hypothetical protein
LLEREKRREGDEKVRDDEKQGAFGESPEEAEEKPRAP